MARNRNDHPPVVGASRCGLTCMGMVYMRPVPGFEGIYSATVDGRIYSHPRVDARGHRRRGKYLRPIADRDGYLRVHTCIGGVRQKKSIHRMVAAAFIPNDDSKPEINHISGKKSNNSVTNLEWCTLQENYEHAIALGLKPYNPPRSAMTGQFIGDYL